MRIHPHTIKNPTYTDIKILYNAANKKKCEEDAYVKIIFLEKQRRWDIHIEKIEQILSYLRIEQQTSNRQKTDVQIASQTRPLLVFSFLCF